jgi:hypothetical protein
MEPAMVTGRQTARSLIQTFASNAPGSSEQFELRLSKPKE